ncbi:hypothetical protein L227DRAFT_581060, partial [Lentinus tigrinus ALCF2SS1-6]
YGREKLRKHQNTSEVTREHSEPRALVPALAEHAVLDSLALVPSPSRLSCTAALETASAFVPTRLTVPRSGLSLAPDFLQRTPGAACGGRRRRNPGELALGQRGKPRSALNTSRDRLEETGAACARRALDVRSGLGHRSKHISTYHPRDLLQ